MIFTGQKEGKNKKESRRRFPVVEIGELIYIYIETRALVLSRVRESYIKYFIIPIYYHPRDCRFTNGRD